MASLRPYNYARLILQGLGFIPGLFGLGLVYTSIMGFVQHKASYDFLDILFGVTLPGIGVPLLFLSYKWIREFSIDTIKCLSLILALLFLGWFFDLIDTYIEKTPNMSLADHRELLELARIPSLASIPLALLLYFICRDVLIILTRANEDQQNT